MTGQATRIRKAKSEAAKAEEFIETATEAATNGKPKRKRGGEWPCTADEIVAERDSKGLSWAQVAINLNLGSPGQARKAYGDLTGRPHHTSQMTGKRASRAAAAGRKVDSPGWNDDTDQGEIEARLNGPWVEASGTEGSKNYVPAHWTGSDIVVRREVGGRSSYVWEEEIQVKYVVEFTFGKRGDLPLAVTFIDRYCGQFRIIAVADIIQVR